MPTKDSKSDFPPQNQLPPSYHQSYSVRPPIQDEIDLRELWQVVWQGKWIIIVITFLFALGAVSLALYLPNIYQSKTLLAPSDEAQGGGMSRMAGQLGGLASLAGINLGNSGGQNKVDVAIEVLRSRQFVSEFIKKYDLLATLMAADGWNRDTGEIYYDPSIYDEADKLWVREVRPPKKKEPSSWEAYKEFRRVLSISRDEKTGFVTIAVEHYSPIVAQRWTQLLVKEINEVVRKKDVDEAQRSISYLQEKMSQVPLAEMRNVFYQLIEEQTKIIMLAEVRDEYIFSTIDPPVVPEEKDKPKRALICVLGTVLGLIFAVMIVFIKHLLRQSEGKS